MAQARENSKGKRRGRRLLAAQSLLSQCQELQLDAGGAGANGKPDGLGLLDNPLIQPRSQTEDASSQLFAPKWRRLLRAVAQRLSQRCEESISERSVAAVTSKLKNAFTHGDAVGGGTEEDVTHCLTRCLDVMELSDADIGFTLLSAYQFLQEQDLPFCSQTWRPLLVTAVLVAVDSVCGGSKESQMAAARIQRHVAHWWPKPKADEGRVVFTSRDSFRTATRSEIAKLYFELRDTGLRAEPGDEGDCNDSVVAVFLAEVAGPGAGGATTLGKQNQGLRAQPKVQSKAMPGRGNPADEDSLNFSDTLSMSFSADDKFAGNAGSASRSAMRKRTEHMVSL